MLTRGVRTLGARSSNVTRGVGREPGTLDHSSPTRYHCAMLACLIIYHLKHLGPRGTHYLTHLYNHSLHSANIPAIWKQAVIIPISKVGKLRHLGTSYRPMLLLSPAVKVLERLILTKIVAHLPLAENQHGFRKDRSTTSALLPITQIVV